MGFVIGLTGGIGSGKSTVLDVLENEYNAQICQEDLLAKVFMAKGGPAYEPIVNEFGEEILGEDGEIDSKKLGPIVFNDEERMKVLESLTHPLVVAEVDRLVEENTGILVVESALPDDAQFERFCDEIWYVHVPVETRIERLMAGRGYSRQKCLDAMASQLSEREFYDMADRVIENGGPIEAARIQARMAMDEILREMEPVR